MNLKCNVAEGGFKCGVIYGNKVTEGYEVFHENGMFLGDIETVSSGDYVFWPEFNGGYLNEPYLFSLAFALEELNRPYQEQLDKFFDEWAKKSEEDKGDIPF